MIRIHCRPLSTSSWKTFPLKGTTCYCYLHTNFLRHGLACRSKESCKYLSECREMCLWSNANFYALCLPQITVSRTLGHIWERRRVKSKKVWTDSTACTSKSIRVRENRMQMTEADANLKHSNGSMSFSLRIKGFNCRCIRDSTK